MPNRHLLNYIFKALIWQGSVHTVFKMTAANYSQTNDKAVCTLQAAHGMHHFSGEEHREGLVEYIHIANLVRRSAKVDAYSRMECRLSVFSSVT